MDCSTENPTNTVTVQKEAEGVPIVAQWVKNLARIHEEVCLMSGLAQWVKNLASIHEEVCLLSGLRIWPHMQLGSGVAVAVA